MFQTLFACVKPLNVIFIVKILLVIEVPTSWMNILIISYYFMVVVLYSLIGFNPKYVQYKLL